MCAKSARNNLGMATSHIPSDYSNEFHAFVDQQKTLYKKYSGFLLGCGEIASFPEYVNGLNWWMARISPLRSFGNPIYIDDFRSFITISRTNSITELDDNDWERLRWEVNRKNPGFFENVIPPDPETLKREFEAQVHKEAGKELKSLEKTAKKKSAKPEAVVVETKVYQRDPTIAAYVKKKANGHCQLCGAAAPFIDQNGDPFLECHHIDWLSKGGMDSVDNCVALCPNCHRKMHILNDPNDIKLLKANIV